MNRVKLVLCAVCGVMLAGCGSSAVSTVQESKYEQDPTFTMGQILNNREVCESVSWRTIKDDRNRTVVEYRCDLKSSGDLLRSTAKAYVAEEERSFTAYLAVLDANLQKKKDSLQRHKEDLARIEGASSDQALMSALDLQTEGMSPEVQALEIQRVKSERVASLSSLIDSGEREIVSWEGAQSQNRSQLAAEQEAKVRTAKALGQAKEVQEVYRWVIDSDGNPVLTYGGYEILADGGSTLQSIKYPYPAMYMGKAAENKARNFEEYVGPDLAGMVGGRI